MGDHEAEVFAVLFFTVRTLPMCFPFLSKIRAGAMSGTACAVIGVNLVTLTLSLRIMLQ